MSGACFDCPCDTRETTRIHCCMQRWKDEPIAVPVQPLSRQQRRALEREKAR